ncbi:MAG: GTP 3',8-cyclase MoaA [Acidobacteriota bacterium]|nr:GTP 3',8-cyclase MoaA [Acidobacteriota bacterium]
MPAELQIIRPSVHGSPEPEAHAVLQRLQLLRLSVTDLCNLRCRYCMPRAGVPRLAHNEILSFEHLVRLVEWLAAGTGLTRIRLTGGEPLARPGIEALIRQLKSIERIREISLTTNATLLAPRAEALKLAGLSRVNISLDSVDPERFAQVTRGGNLQRALDGIRAARHAGLTPIKINAVLRRSTWQKDVPQLLDFAAAHGFEIRFIELMRTGTEREWCESEFVAAGEVCRGLGVPLTLCSGPAKGSARRTMLEWRGRLHPVGWITPRSHPFCASCDRLRLDTRGLLRRCLMDPQTFDLCRTLAEESELSARRRFAAYIAAKRPPSFMDTSCSMSQIGG